MIFPYGTDARVRYWPYTTVAVIAICSLVFLAELISPQVGLALSLDIGNGLRPYQWITANLVHVEFWHLFWNMLELWIFGLVVEGKLGWSRSLAVYMALGIAPCAVDQLLFLGGKQAYFCGASGIVFGTMAMSVVWAPENSVLFIHAWWYIRRFSIRISVLFIVIVAIQLGVVIAAKSASSTTLLHLVATAAGFGVATWLLKTRRVDCENWDIFSIQAGRHKMSLAQREEEALKDPEYRRRREVRREESLEKVRTLIRNGHPAVAWAAYQRMAKDQGEIFLPEADLCALISAFHKDSLWSDSIPAMAEYLARFSERALPVRIKLAEILATENRPMQAIRVMAKIDRVSLSENNRVLLENLRAEAEKRQAEDLYEVADEDW